MKRRIVIIATFLFLLGLLGLWGCGSPSSDYKSTEHEQSGLKYEKSMELLYAENFSVDYYEGGYKILTTIPNEREYLIVPEGKEAPENLSEAMEVIKGPIEDIYLVASAVMDMFSELDGLDTISFSGRQADDWYIEKAKEAMENGDMIYAGKYSQPDYELIVSKGCKVAIENTMIFHSPQVIEKLEDFNIPVMVEYSSYENHPLGRVEWIKFFAALIGKEEQAEEIFDRQSDILNKVISDKKTGKTVGFFFITSNGLAQIRRPSDYIPKIINLAGGKYIFDQFGDDDSKKSTMNIQIEEFYNAGKDADYLIYNSSIDGGVDSIDELIEKCQVLSDFKAVKEKNVWCTTSDMYQQSMSVGYLTEDIHNMLEGKSEDDMHYLFPLR